MSVSWDILEGAPVAPASLVAEAARYAALLTGHDGWRFEARGEVDGEEWEGSSAAAPSAQRPVVNYELDIVATIDGHTGTVFVSSGQETEDDGSPVAGHAAVEVVAHRTQTSTVAGMAVGLAAYALSGGEFSGVGLGRWYRPDELHEVQELLSLGDANSAAPDEAISLIGKKLGISHLTL